MDDERSFTAEIPIRSRELPRRDPALATHAKMEGVIHSRFEHHFRLSQPQYQQSKCPEGLKIISGAFEKTFRDRSPTASTISSTHVPDSATTCSMPMSPTLSTFTRATTPDIDGPERLHTPFIATRSGTNGHRYRESCDSGSTFVDSINEEKFPAYPESIGMGYKDDPLQHMGIDEAEDDGQNDMHHTAGTPRPQARDDAPESPCEAPFPIPSRPLSDRMSFDSGSDRLSRAWEPATPTPVDFPDEEADAVLDYVLQVTYGVELDEVNMPPSFLRQFASRFMQDIGRFAFSGFPVATQLTHTTSTSSNGSMPLARRSGSDRGSQNGKRKKGETGRLDGGDDGDDLTDDDGDSSVPFKRARATPREVDENLRLSCPFRKRNPHRFNVREYHSCAMTYFKFAELRQHIVKQHKRNDSSSFMCDRCNRAFPSKRELRDHQRLPREQMCDVSDHDPESGIDGPTMTKLLSRKRASGMTPEEQWREIWNLLFPDDDDYRVQPFDFCPVIEHFELQAQFMNSLKDVGDRLRDKGMTQQALETIGNIYRNQFIQVIEQCIADSQMMPYSNRSNRKNGPSPSRSVAPRHLARNAPRPDSGVDVDDGSEDSQSIAIFPGGVFDGHGMLAQSDSVRTVRRVSSTSSEFRNSVLPRTLQPLMEQLPASGQGIGGSPSPRQKLSPAQQQQQQMPQQPLMSDQNIDLIPMMSGMTPEMAAQLWAYRDVHVETRSSAGEMNMYPPAVDTNGQNQFLDWNSGLQDNNGMYNFSGYMPR